MVYAVKEGNRIWRMSKNREELEEYLKSFDLEERRKMYIIQLNGDSDKEEEIKQ